MMFMNYAQRVLGPTLTPDQIPSVELKTIYNSFKNENLLSIQCKIKVYYERIDT